MTSLRNTLESMQKKCIPGSFSTLAHEQTNISIFNKKQMVSIKASCVMF